MNESSLNQFKYSLEGCQFDTASAHERVWLDDPPEFPDGRYLVLISSDRLENEIQNQLECWHSRIPHTILVCLPFYQHDNVSSVLRNETVEAGILQNLCDCLNVHVNMKSSEILFEVYYGIDSINEVS